MGAANHSGFFVFSKVGVYQTEKEKKRAILQSVRRYLLLYALWLVIHLPVIDWTRFGYGRVSVRHFLFNLFQHFLLEETFRGSWYLMACILGIPIVHFLHTKMSERIVLYCGIALYIMITLYALGKSAWPNWPLTAQMDQMVKRMLLDPESSFLIAIPYLTLGKRIAEQKERLCSKGQTIAGLTVCLALLYVEYQLLKTLGLGGYTRTCYLMLAPTSFFLVMLVLQTDMHLKHAHLMRTSSTLVYFLHIPVMEIVHLLCASCEWYQQDQNHIVLFISTATVCLSISFIIDRLEKKNGFHFLRYLH